METSEDVSLIKASLPTLDLKGLWNLCIKFNVKKYGTKEALRIKLMKAIEDIENAHPNECETEDDILVDEVFVEEQDVIFTTDSLVKDLKLACVERGISKNGNKKELVDRLNKWEDIKKGSIVPKNPIRTKNSVIPRIGGKGLTSSCTSNTAVKQQTSQASKSLEIERTDSADNPKYSGLKVADLRAKLREEGLNQAGVLAELINRLEIHDKRKDVLEKNNQNYEDKIPCDSCNIPGAFSASKCMDCNENICNKCKEAHLRLKITKNHVIIPHVNFLVKDPKPVMNTKDDDMETVLEQLVDLNIQKCVPWYEKEKTNNISEETWRDSLLKKDKTLIVNEVNTT